MGNCSGRQLMENIKNNHDNSNIAQLAPRETQNWLQTTKDDSKRRLDNPTSSEQLQQDGQASREATGSVSIATVVWIRHLRATDIDWQSTKTPATSRKDQGDTKSHKLLCLHALAPALPIRPGKQRKHATTTPTEAKPREKNL